MAKACSECDGLGEVFEVLPCLGCGGSGIIPGTPPQPCLQKCDNGQVKTGRKLKCTNCQGTGREPDLW